MRNKLSLAVFTEASKDVGTGHLIESLNLVKLARKNGLNVDFWVNGSSPKPILNKIPFSYGVFSDLNEARNILKAKKFDSAVFNFRSINNGILRTLVGNGLKRLCIDEFGGRRLDCDAIVNPVIVDRYHRYPASGRKAKLYTGAGYLSISNKFIEARKKKRIFKGAIREVTVCMGGVDRSGATLNIIEALTQWRKKVKKNIILGAGFLFLSEIKAKTRLLKSLNFRIYRNINNVVPLFMSSDVVFTAGGNTLYELACLGTPAIVLYEDKHEQENGLAFARRGFGVCLGKGSSAKKEIILSALAKFDAPGFRSRLSLKGRRIVDGKGTERILNILEGLSKK